MGPPGWAGTRRELLDFTVQGKINTGRHTDHPAGHHTPSRLTSAHLHHPSHVFYRPDALPASQPTVSKHIVACWPYHVTDVAHSAVRHSQLPDPLSGTCMQTNSETPTALSLHSDSHWRHSSSTSISTLQQIRGVTVMRYINLHFTYLLTYTEGNQQVNKHHHHNRFNGPFSGTTRVSRCQNRTLDFMVQGEINRGRYTDHPAGRHSIWSN